MTRSFHNKPRVTQSGLTSIRPNTLRRWPTGERMTADQGVQDALEKCRTMTLTSFANIDLWQDAEYWEFCYIHDFGSSRYAPNLSRFERWQQFAKIREDRKGLYTICGNFEELSYAFVIETYDRALVVEFAKAFMANPGWPAIINYHLEGVKKFSDMRRVYGVEYVERD